ncbi:ACP phosphodiesterase [Gallaecimonas kandeliae]|uniref:acyl carrier protein phosphodiesterase n=1 Tax=Gallaecimonas kandeliae TaxID=3029055 RepID=UPI002649FF1C|nr:ACP phosphodiesterase [Gallaecimonas kandeliae]WKE65635.1 ACP phosphodiesterase [Gallaecimonas kandeliae]
MNFLAHLHIADHCDSSLLGNLLGDFVKGEPQAQLAPKLAAGVMLHRFVDSYSDSHRLTRAAKELFPGRARRFSPIALDMFWDHCLARRWADFHPESLRAFCQNAELLIQGEHSGDLPPRYLQVSASMWRNRWLESYRDFATVELALERMSGRSPRMAELVTCFPYLEQGRCFPNPVNQSA